MRNEKSVIFRGDILHIYYELNEIKVPSFAHPDGLRLYINYDAGEGKTKKIYIGNYASKIDNTFYPNENFRLYCPTQWNEAYGGSNVPHYRYGVGMYAMTLTISHNINLYQLLHKEYGPLYGNALLDFAMYSIQECSNVAYRFKPAMEHEVIFSKDRNDDTWLSEMFGTKINDDMTDKFKIGWVEECKRRGITKVWISLDGSNSSNECTICELSQDGDNKTKKNKPCIGYMYALSLDGTPVTYTTFPGDQVDSKALVRIIEFLTSFDIEILGVILDRGFLTHSAINLIRSKNLPFIIMLKEDTYAHTQMIIEHGEEIFWDVGHLVGTDALFGICDGPKLLFKDYDDEAYINLYFDGKNGSERKVTFVNKLYDVMCELQKSIDAGEVPQIPQNFRQYLDLKEIKAEEETTVKGPDSIDNKTTEMQEQSGNPEATVTGVTRKEDKDKSSMNNTSEALDDDNSKKPKPKYKIVASDKCTKKLYKKGFESIASSNNWGPQEVNRLYHLRDVSEKQYMIMKSMHGYNVFRAHSTEGIQTRGVVCFIASIIRHEIYKACKHLNLKTSVMIAQIERPMLALLHTGEYKFIDDLKGDTKKLFDYVGCSSEEFEAIAGDINEREKALNGKGVSQYHKSPEEIKEAHKRLRENARKKKHTSDFVNPPTEQEEEIKVVRRPGRPLGRKNNKTLAREANKSDNAEQNQPKRKPGRPPGRKNNKTLEREAAGIIPPIKRKKGRPTGSKDTKPRKRRKKHELNGSQQSKIDDL